MNRRIFVILSLSILVLLLAGFTVYEMFELKHAETVNRANELAADSVSLRDSRFDLSLLLSVEAYRHAETIQTKGALLDNVQAAPELVKYWHLPGCTFDNLAVSPDGAMIATGCYGEKIILVDRSTQKIIRELKTKPDKPEMGHINQLVFSSDGRYLIADIFRKNYPNRFISIWDVSSGKSVDHPELESLSADGFAFSPDGKKMAICEWGKVSILDMPTLTLDGRFEIGLFLGLGGRNAFPQVLSLVFSPDSKTLAGISSVNQVTLWDVSTQKKIGQPFQIGEEYSQNGVGQIVYTGDGHALLAIYADGSLIAWDINKREQIIQTPPQLSRGQYLSTRTSKDINPKVSLLAVSDGNTVKITNFQTGQEKFRLTGNANQLSWMTFTPDGNGFIAGNLNQFVFWNFFNPNILKLKSIENKGSTFTLSPDEKILASDNLGLVEILDIKSNSLIAILGKGEERASQPIAFSPDSKIMAAGNFSGITLWNTQTWTQEGEPFTTVVDEIHSPEATGVTFTPDGKTLIFDGGSAIHFWDISTRKEIGEPIIGYLPWRQTVPLSPDGSIIAVRDASLTTNNNQNTITLWDVQTHHRIGNPMIHPYSIYSIVFDPTGKILATSDSQYIRLWNVTTQKIIRQPVINFSNSIPTTLTFSPDGRILVVGYYKNSLALLDVASQQFVGNGIQTIEWPVDEAVFTKDGKTMVTSSDNVDFWDVDPQSWSDKNCQRAGRNLTRTEWDYFLPDEPYRATCPLWPVDEIKTNPTETAIAN